MRTWTSRRIAAKAPMKADDMNVELSDAARVVNGGIGQHNLPVGSTTEGIVPGKLVTPSIENAAFGSTLSVYLAANSYHRSVLAATDKVTPRITISPETEDLSHGWRALYLYQSGQTVAGTVCEFVSRGGMIHGQCQVDVERRMSYLKHATGPTYPVTHDDSWVQIGVFANDVLVADSGRLYPARQTQDLPFSFPAPEGRVRIETRFRAYTRFRTAAAGDFSYPAPSERYPDMFVYGTYLFARNQYR